MIEKTENERKRGRVKNQQNTSLIIYAQLDIFTRRRALKLPFHPPIVGNMNLLCSVTRKKSPNVYKNCPKMILLEK